MGGLVSGSSPRVRGTLSMAAGPGTHHRFIPACAGNTDNRRFGSRTLTVHPRVCGEHLKRCSSVMTWSGSSPRVRGTRSDDQVFVERARFIPACAGNTRRTAVGPGGIAVHPRVCGEHVVE